MNTQIIKILIFVILVLTAIFSMACSLDLGKVSFEKACTGENEQNVKVEGYIANDSISCSSDSSGQRTCSFTLTESLSENKGHEIFFSLAEGKNGNQVETTENGGQKSTFARENIKIRGDNGSIINLREKVSVAGKTTLIISSTMMPVCRMNITGIEQ